MMGEAGAGARLSGLAWAWEINSLFSEANLLCLGCPAQHLGRPTAIPSIARTLATMMDGGDMLNYSGFVSSSSW